MAVKIICLPQDFFDEKMTELGLDDNNVESHNDMAFISIIGTSECLRYYLDEADTKHYFSENHSNVLNLDFDDISRDLMYKGHLFKTMTMNQAEETIRFIEKSIENGVKKFYVHCRAGISRSRAVSEMIARILGDLGVEIEYCDRYMFSNHVNKGVLRKLSHAYWKMHSRYEYEDGGEYPKDLCEGLDVIEDKKEGDVLF